MEIAMSEDIESRLKGIETEMTDEREKKYQDWRQACENGLAKGSGEP
jgi:hypothetical protein